MNENKCECSGRIKKRGDDEYKKLINRLNRIEGQVRGIRKMVENDAQAVRYTGLCDMIKKEADKGYEE